MGAPIHAEHEISATATRLLGPRASCRRRPGPRRERTRAFNPVETTGLRPHPQGGRRDDVCRRQPRSAVFGFHVRGSPTRAAGPPRGDQARSSMLREHVCEPTVRRVRRSRKVAEQWRDVLHVLRGSTGSLSRPNLSSSLPKCCQEKN